MPQNSPNSSSCSKIRQYLQLFTNRRIAIMLFLGFSSGMPLALTGGTLQAWMTVAGVNIKTIGIFGLAGLPYTMKFLWSPLMDRFVPPWLGRRRGWIISTQLGLLIVITLMAFSSPENEPALLAVFALTAAFLSASQDIVIDAYRTDILHEQERGFGAGVFVMGYRIAMLVSGALALILSDRIGWHNTYLLMTGFMTIGIIAVFCSPEPDEKLQPPRSIQEAVSGPLKDFFSRRFALIFLLLIIMYKLGDAFAGSLTTAFLIRGVGFTATEVGAVNKGFGLIATIVGALFGGALMVRLGLFRSLMIFGILQGVSILSFMFLAWTGKSYAVMIFAVAFENITAGMGTAAFVSLLMALCNHRFSATQYALLSSFAALGRIFIAPASGYLVESEGWVIFFLVATLSAVPGLLLLWRLRTEISGLEHERS